MQVLMTLFVRCQLPGNQIGLLRHSTTGQVGSGIVFTASSATTKCTSNSKGKIHDNTRKLSSSLLGLINGSYHLLTAAAEEDSSHIPINLGSGGVIAAGGRIALEKSAE